MIGKVIIWGSVGEKPDEEVVLYEGQDVTGLFNSPGPAYILPKDLYIFVNKDEMTVKKR